jgi:DNA-binding MarR family transcriptional regulator
MNEGIVKMGRDDVVRDISAMVMRWQDVTQAYDEAVRARHQLSLTEGMCLSELFHGPRTAGALAAASGLTPAAITALIDRLEARGFVTRTRSAEDRRKVMVEMGPKAQEVTDRHYLPIGSEGLRALEAYTDMELKVIRRFLIESVELQEKHLAALQAEEEAQATAGR